MLLWQNLLKQIEKLKKNKSSYRGSIENSLRTSDLPVSYTWAYQRQSCFKDFKNLLVIKFYQLIQQMNLIILERFTLQQVRLQRLKTLLQRLSVQQKTFFLLNGSTAGNLAIGMSLTKKGKKVIINRNCHRSALTGLMISGAEPIWICPSRIDDWSIWGSIQASTIEEILKNNDDVGLVWITNPTYEGVVSDIKSISAVCKKYNVPLVVDEAHGCLWNFNKHLPITALKLGADAVVHSLHKTGGSMSQSSMLHIAKESLINPDSVEKALKLLHTTSPSLLLLASLDAAHCNTSI